MALNFITMLNFNSLATFFNFSKNYVKMRLQEPAPLVFQGKVP
jgi:hypothetical protein